MFIDKISGFVICRDGHILVTNENKTFKLSGYVQYSAASTTTSYLHYFPIAPIILNRIVTLDTLYLRIKILTRNINIFNKLIQSKLERSKLNKTKQLIESLTKLKEDYISDLMNLHSKSNEVENTTANEEIALAMDENGIIKLCSMKFIKHDTDGIVCIIKEQKMPVDVDSQWVISHRDDITNDIEAAMRSTKTKEELLVLLRKIGYIKEGVWITPKEYFNNNNIVGIMNNIHAQSDKEMDTFILNKLA